MLITRLLRDLFFSAKKPVGTFPQPVNRDAGDSGERYSFTVDWFSPCIPAWSELLSQIPETGKVLEIGSYEGRSAVWLIENAFKAGGKGELYCIDTWKGSMEHDAADMPAVEKRFLRNIATAKTRSRSDVTVHVLKGSSSALLASLVSEGHTLSFDLIHVDGSHECPDVLSDLVLSIQLCKIGGLILCDDYDYDETKLAIDSFVSCYRHKLMQTGCNVRQIYFKKTAA